MQMANKLDKLSISLGQTTQSEIIHNNPNNERFSYESNFISPVILEDCPESGQSNKNLINYKNNQFNYKVKNTIQNQDSLKQFQFNLSNFEQSFDNTNDLNRGCSNSKNTIQKLDSLSPQVQQKANNSKSSVLKTVYQDGISLKNIAKKDDLNKTTSIKNKNVNKCSLCLKSAKNQCSKCKTVYYCSKDCQVKHWNLHKKVCKNKLVNNIKNKTIDQNQQDSDSEETYNEKQEEYEAIKNKQKDRIEI